MCLVIPLFLAPSSGQRHLASAPRWPCLPPPGGPSVHVPVVEAGPMLDVEVAVGHVPQGDVTDPVTVEVTGERLVVRAPALEATLF
jgi:hypothetical protein